MLTIAFNLITLYPKNIAMKKLSYLSFVLWILCFSNVTGKNLKARFAYATFFSPEKIKNYSNIWYSIFIFHLVMLYMVLFIEVSELSIGSPFNNSTSLVTDIIYNTLSLLQLS